jgi:Mandelate racemase / muconate lactonizing enzyme, N-terminal domain
MRSTSRASSAREDRRRPLRAPERAVRDCWGRRAGTAPEDGIPAGCIRACRDVRRDDRNRRGIRKGYAPEALVEQLAPELAGLDALDIDDVVERLRVATGYWGRLGFTRGAVGTIEMALWDITGHAHGVPVVALLGGSRHEALPVYARVEARSLQTRFAKSAPTRLQPAIGR